MRLQSLCLILLWLLIACSPPATAPVRESETEPTREATSGLKKTVITRQLAQSVMVASTLRLGVVPHFGSAPLW